MVLKGQVMLNPPLSLMDTQFPLNYSEGIYLVGHVHLNLNWSVTLHGFQPEAMELILDFIL
jgi:hypothetical protein